MVLKPRNIFLTYSVVLKSGKNCILFSVMKLACYSATDIGPVRQKHQDSIMADGDRGLFIVADGMGGHQGGEVASKLAIQTVSKKLESIKKQKTLSSKDIRVACLEANRVIYNEGQKDLSLRGMGTTLCFLTVKEDGKAYIANIGDSRMYMEKEGQMWLLTEDHNFITNQVKTCFLSGDPVPEPSAENSVLTRSVGFFATVEPDIFEKTVEKGEKYLICSDGFSGFVPEKDIHAILRSRPLQDIPDKCIKKAVECGSDDNISVIVVEAL